MKRVNIYKEANRCLMCQDAPCTKACKTGDPARAIRAIRFDNHKPALRWVKNCSDEDLERAEQACIHYNWPIRPPCLPGWSHRRHQTHSEKRLEKQAELREIYHFTKC